MITSCYTIYQIMLYNSESIIPAYKLRNFKQHESLKLYCVFVIVFIFSASSEAQYLNYSEEPTVTEYDVDSTWPHRPENISDVRPGNGEEGYVTGVAIDKKEQAWFCKKGKDPIQVYTTEGKFVRSWGNGQFQSPHALKIDHEGNIWVADFGLHVVRKFTPLGALLLTLGTYGEKGEDDTHLNQPTDMAITRAGDVFVTDGYGNRRIVHYDKQGKFIKSWGQYGNAPGSFVLPHSIVVDSKGRLYVGDRNSGRIEVFDQNGKLLDQWSNLIMPWGMSINAKDEIWICGSSPHWWMRNGRFPEYKDQVFMRFSTDGCVQQIWHIPLGNVGKDKNHPDFSNLKAGEAVGVHAIAQNSRGDLFVGEVYSQRIEKFIPIIKRHTSDKQRPVDDTK